MTPNQPITTITITTITIIITITITSKSVFKNIMDFQLKTDTIILNLIVNLFIYIQTINIMQSRMAKRLQKEYQSMSKNNETFAVQLVNNDLRIWRVTFEGAKNTIYSGQKFLLQFKFSDQYPIESPEVVFVGKPPEHEHIYSNGFICLSILYDEWSPALTVASVCISILSMLSSAAKKMKPKNDAQFIVRAAGRGPKSFLWSFDDDKV